MDITSVLLIDDEDDIREIGEFALSDVGGLTVAVASSGPEGVARAVSARPDVILLDVMMPLVDGPTTLQSLRANTMTADIPVIFLTARVGQAGRDRLLQLGALAVIAKPFDPETIAHQVRAACAQIKPLSHQNLAAHDRATNSDSIEADRDSKT